MPQLDSNTFGYQYFGIVFILIVVYILLSYIALPALLRTMMIRDFFLKTTKSLSSVSSVLTLKNTNIVLLQDSFTFFVTTKILFVLNKFFSNASNVISALNSTNLNSKVGNSLSTNFVVFTTYVSYISFLLALEEN